MMTKSQKSIEKLKNLIKNGLNPLDENQDLQNIIHRAVFWENQTVLEYLLDSEMVYKLSEEDNLNESGTKIDSSPRFENSISESKRELAPTYVINSLISLDKPTKNDGFTPLHAAWVTGNLKIVQLILDWIQKR